MVGDKSKEKIWFGFFGLNVAGDFSSHAWALEILSSLFIAIEQGYLQVLSVSTSQPKTTVLFIH